MNKTLKTIKRPPVVVVMGHIDHGKSTLLDYIRKTNVTATESGGITQHLSAYQAHIKNDNGVDEKITFLDTPGHAAFSDMRNRGASVADIAILVVSAEDGVKTQTTEAYKSIKESGIPFIVAINKIDKPEANIEKTKIDLAGIDILVEGFGGDIPFAPVSAITGEGIDNLLELIILTRDLNDFQATTDDQATGFVIEANRDPKRGISATMIIKEGSIKKGDFIATKNAMSTTRIMEDFNGKLMAKASVSDPMFVVGFDNMPTVGDAFVSFSSKKEAEKYIEENKKSTFKNERKDFLNKIYLPLIIKTDSSGTEEAVISAVKKLEKETIAYRIISSGAGAINEKDIKAGQVDTDGQIVGFKVDLDKGARDLNESAKVKVATFDIIYKLTEYLEEYLESKRPRETVEEIIGKVRILKCFSETKERQVVGGKVIEGKAMVNCEVKIVRRDAEIGKGLLTNLEGGKIKLRELDEGNDCGMQVQTKVTIATGDILVFYTQKEI